MKFSNVPPMTPAMFEAFLAKHTVFCLRRVEPISAGRAHPDLC